MFPSRTQPNPVFKAMSCPGCPEMRPDFRVMAKASSPNKISTGRGILSKSSPDLKLEIICN